MVHLSRTRERDYGYLDAHAHEYYVSSPFLFYSFRKYMMAGDYGAQGERRI